MVELWKDALNTLCRSEPLIRGRIEDKVYNPIKWSYDVLPNECIKSCFLFCCLFPEDFEINVKELVRYWLAEGLLEGHHDIEEVMDRGMTIIEILKDGSLLEQVYPSTVKLHDVIRDVSVWISSSVQKECKSLVRSGIGLHRIREGELLGKSYKRVSFMNNQINELPNMVKECPTVSTLLLQQNKALEGVQDQFLAAFMSLKILDLSYCNLIKSLPPCLDQLGELRALVLDSCTHLETLPPLGGLAKLQVLVCSGTDIAALPQGTEKLTSLRLLDLSYNSRLAVIHCGVMSGLCNLEYLDMRGNKRLKFIGERGEISNLFEEISHLDRLIVLLVGLDSSACTIETTNTLVNRMMKFKKFELSIGSSSKVTTVDLERTKVVSLLNIHVWGERMEWLFVNSTSVYFQCCESLDVAFEKLAANSDEVGSFDTVKFLFISDSTGWFGVGSHAKFDMLPNLENIFFEDLTHVSGISDLVPPLGLKFSKLRYIKVAGCPELKYLITTRVPLTLEMLEEISVHRCKKVEQLFKFDHQNSVLFPNLEKINLSSCPKLKYLISLGTTMPLALEMLKEVSVHHCEQLEQLFKFDDHHQNSVLFPKLKKINLFECPKLKYLISLGTIMPLALEMLERVVVHRCEQVEQLFKFDHHHHHHHNSVLFPNLKKIDLSDCPKLRLLIEEKNNVGCPRLEEVSVWRCPLLKKLPISPQNVGTIKTIRGEQEWWDGLEWDNDHIKNNLQSYFKP
ncbi:UNVERIFIED_CONTAM: Disease resistance protein [Sesamum radiatum]|uniref:Disease resistance protein n=1 Tax=Sesamum radiatum TaxID=300843 RepID=A0AAW2VJ06_SESRA